jgi:hypothetical protein
MKLAVLVNSKDALSALVKQNLPIGIAWDMKMFISNIDSELRSYEEVRVSKIMAYGELVKDESGNDTDQTQVKSENIEIFTKEINEILEKEIEIEVPVITISDLTAYSKKSKEPIFITTNDLILLDWLIKS